MNVARATHHYRQGAESGLAPGPRRWSRKAPAAGRRQAALAAARRPLARRVAARPQVAEAAQLAIEAVARRARASYTRFRFSAVPSALPRPPRRGVGGERSLAKLLKTQSPQQPWGAIDDRRC